MAEQKKTLSSLKKELSENPVARCRLVADVLNVLESHGVDVNDPEVQKKLNIDLEPSSRPVLASTDGWAISLVGG